MCGLAGQAGAGPAWVGLAEAGVCARGQALGASGAHPHWGLTVPRHAVAPQLHRWDPQHWLGTPQREMHLTGAGCAEQGTDCNQIRVFLKPDAG